MTDLTLFLNSPQSTESSCLFYLLFEPLLFTAEIYKMVFQSSAMQIWGKRKGDK